MQVRLRTVLAAPLGAGNPGDVIDVSDAQAIDLVTGGYAERLDRADAMSERKRTRVPKENAMARGAPERAVDH